MAAGNKHLGYKAALNAIEARVAGHEGRVLLRLPRPHGAAPGRPTRRPTAPGSAACRTLRRADDRRGVRVLPPRRARRRPTSRSRSSCVRRGGRQVTDVRLRRQGAAPRRQGPALPRHPDGGRRVPHPRRLRRPTPSSSASPRASSSRATRGAAVHRAAPDARGLRARDAARRAGDLPEGPRRRSCMLADIAPGRAGARDRRRVGRAVDDDAARGRRHRRLRAARGLRQPGPGQRRARSSATRCSTATASSCATATRASTSSDLDRVVLDLPEPWQVVPHAEEALRAGRDPRRLHAVDHPGRRSCARRWPARRVDRRPGRSRCSTATGTSRARRCGPTTAWSPTPASSPPPGLGA